jgi:F-type H+-transporting ATPase subunit gamma
MPSTREIRRRIRSVKNLAQITRAMEMVSASKMRRAQRNVLATRPYADRLLDVMGELTGRAVGMRRGTLLEVRPVVQGVALIVVTPDRGLAGSLVANVLRRASRFILDEQEKKHTVEVLAIGKKGRDFMVRTHQNLVAEVTKLGDYPRSDRYSRHFDPCYQRLPGRALRRSVCALQPVRQYPGAAPDDQTPAADRSAPRTG